MKRILTALLFLTSTILWAQIPKTLNFQGVLTDPANDLPVEDGNYGFLFGIYNVETGGTALWTENQSLATSNGQYNAILGSVSPIDIDGTENYWLEISVNGNDLGRVELTSTAYLLDDDIEDLADGSLSGTKVGTGVNAGNITTGSMSGNRISGGTVTANVIGEVSGNATSATSATSVSGPVAASQITGIPIPVAWGYIDGFNYSDAANKYYTIKSSSSNILWVKEAYQGDEGWFPGTYTIKLSGIDLNDGEYLIMSNLTASFSSSISAGQAGSFSDLISVYIVNISDSHIDYPSQNAFNQGDFYFMVYKVQ
ncbi:MAG: hypothetical protein ACJAT1_001685 [Marivirga sp.]|jgi:hypothetical protein